MAISRAEWAEIEKKIKSVDQAGIIEKHNLFVEDINKQIKDINKQIDCCVKSLDAQMNEKFNEIDEEAKKRKALLEKNRFAYTLDCVLSVLEKHGYQGDYLTPILKYTTEYCKMQEKHESYAEWCKTREQGLTERATNKTIFDEFANKRKIL